MTPPDKSNLELPKQEQRFSSICSYRSLFPEKQQKGLANNFSLSFQIYKAKKARQRQTEQAQYYQVPDGIES